MTKTEFKKNHLKHRTRKIKEIVNGRETITHIHCDSCEETWSKGMKQPNR